ncbi:MAG: ABC transporter ATP-binding protein [Acidobacteria bacterium]|nr:MAG: ABC transporter ATP-binding protein [Acidobacteriota bacterium]
MNEHAIATRPGVAATTQQIARADETVVFDNVSKFYGEVLGVNRINLTLTSGIIGLVGPNGSGKTTLMNLMTGLLRPTEGTIRVLGIGTDEPTRLFRLIGYCTQWDSFPRGVTGYELIYGLLRVHGYPHARSDELAWEALERVKLVDAAHRKVAGYSKGMRQRVRLAQALAHKPRVLVLDEPLNGLDPMARAEIIGVFQGWAAEGYHVIISSHILHEVDMIADQVILLSGGYVVAEGEIGGVRTDIEEHPIQVLIRCDKAPILASKLFEHDHVVEVTMHDDRDGLLVRTKDANRFYLALNELVLAHDIEMETITVADADVRAVYQYLIGTEGEATR